ncbi:ComEC/Rec2 family competence protein [Anaerobacillus sp. HL2]|nr:ComEC/Rec2 family competence protein [Anaerobacillus sp. HL2]
MLAGAAPSVLRATAMSIVVLVSIRGRWKISSLDVISFVICLATLIMNFLLLYSI